MQKNTPANVGYWLSLVGFVLVLICMIYTVIVGNGGVTSEGGAIGWLISLLGGVIGYIVLVVGLVFDIIGLCKPNKKKAIIGICLNAAAWILPYIVRALV